MSFRFSWLSECLKPRNFFWSFVPAGGWSVLQMSPSNEDASVAQWYGLGTLNPRTCSIFRHGKGLSGEPYDDLFGSGCRNLVFIFLFILFSSWHRAKPRTLKQEKSTDCSCLFHCSTWFFSSLQGKPLNWSRLLNRSTVPIVLLTDNSFTQSELRIQVLAWELSFSC